MQLALTRFEVQALIAILADYMASPQRREVIIDAEAETRTEHLQRLLAAAAAEEATLDERTREERARAVGLLRRRARDMRSPAVTESLRRHSPLLIALPVDDAGRTREDLAQRLAYALAAEADAAATLIETGTHWFAPRPPPGE